MSATSQDPQTATDKESSVTKDDSNREILDDLDSDVSNEYDDMMSWPSDESDYPHSETEDDGTAVEGISENYDEEVIKWFTHPQSIVSIPYTGKPGLKCQPHSSDPICYFNLLATDEFYSLILNETNKNASKILLGPNSSQISGWIELKLTELKTFLGILYHMGSVAMECVEDYWESYPLLGPSRFSKYMTCNRFLHIMRALHFSEDPEENHSLTAHIKRVKPLIDLYNRTMKKIHGPSRELLVGDSMVLRMNDLIFRVHVKHKTHRSGLKIYMLQESTGLIQKFLVYSRDDDEELTDQSYVQIIQSLMQEYVDMGHSLYPDVLHNSIQLTQDLLKKKIYCTGGLRVSRKHNPVEVLKMKLKKREAIERYNEENICVIKWKDRTGPPALMISSEFNGQMMEVMDRKGIKREKPTLVEKYNQFIKRVSGQEELVSYCPCEHVKMRWYKKLSIYIFHLMMVNAYYLFKMYSNGPRMSFYDFRIEVIKELVQLDAQEP